MSPTYAEDVMPLVDETHAAAPDEIVDAMTNVHEAYQKIATGDESVFEDPEFTTAQGDIAVWVNDVWVNEECGEDGDPHFMHGMQGTFTVS